MLICGARTVQCQLRHTVSLVLICVGGGRGQYNICFLGQGSAYRCGGHTFSLVLICGQGGSAHGRGQLLKDKGKEVGCARGRAGREGSQRRGASQMVGVRALSPEGEQRTA